MSMTLKNFVKDTLAEFVCYRDGELWYKIVRQAALQAGTSDEFPVPVADTGTGVFPAQVKAITLMR